MIKEDRQTNLKTLSFDRIEVIKDYGITERLNNIKDIKELINKVIDECYSKNIKNEYDVDYVHKITVEFNQPHNYDFVKVKNGPPSIKLNMQLYTWETKNEMYSRRSYDKRQLEDKKTKLEKEAGQLGYKLEKVNE